MKICAVIVQTEAPTSLQPASGLRRRRGRRRRPRCARRRVGGRPERRPAGFRSRSLKMLRVLALGPRRNCMCRRRTRAFRLRDR